MRDGNSSPPAFAAAKAEETAQQQRTHVALLQNIQEANQTLQQANLRSQEEIAQLRLQVPVPTFFMMFSNVDSSLSQLQQQQQQQQQQQPSKV